MLEELLPFALYLTASTEKKHFKTTKTHHHANCDRNGNELSNPRTMKMVTSMKTDLLFLQIALLHVDDKREETK